MTVNSIQETQDRVVSDLDQQKSENFSLPEISMQSAGLTEKKGVKEAERDRESGESSDDVDDSLKSVEKWRRINMSKIGIVHSQVLKIRKEDSHLDEDICEGLSAKNKITSAGVGQNMQLGCVSSAVDVVLISRRILPSSPLSGGKTIIKALP